MLTRARSATDGARAGRSSGTGALATRSLNFGLDQLVRRGLRGVWFRGELPATAAVWAANHHSWWDGFVAGAMLSEWHRPAALLMAGENLSEYGFLGKVGVISTGRPRQALAALQAGRVLVVFPEAELRAPGPLAPLAPGAGWLAERASVPLVPVAVRLAIRGHQYPEAYVDIGDPVPAALLGTELDRRLQLLDGALAKHDPREPLPGFGRLVPGRSSWDERISRWSSRLSR